MEQNKKTNIIPLRKTDPFCYSSGGAITNALFLIQMALNHEETEEETVTHLLEIITDAFSDLQEDLHAEMIYKDLVKVQSMVDSFYSEAQACPSCKSFNILVEESEEDTHNTCLDCQKQFTTD